MKERYLSKVAVFLMLTRLHKGEKQILLQKRINTEYMNNMYDMCASGHLEANETIAEALIRETKEEIDITIKPEDVKLLTVVHESERNYLKFCFSVKKYYGKPKINEPNKCSDLSWFNINNLPTNTIPHVKNIIENIMLKINYDDSSFKYQKLKISKNKKEIA
jgi:8-oxo-dGTP pyrophosphatase MutT (NUDIX family)